MRIDKLIHVGDVMKMNSNIISELYQERNRPQPKALTFKPGQILNGKILKVFPNICCNFAGWIAKGSCSIGSFFSSERKILVSSSVW